MQWKIIEKHHIKSHDLSWNLDAANSKDDCAKS